MAKAGREQSQQSWGAPGWLTSTTLYATTSYILCILSRVYGQGSLPSLAVPYPRNSCMGFEQQRRTDMQSCVSVAPILRAVPCSLRAAH